MNYGYIVLADSKTNWISQCIKWFTSSEFSHSFVTIPSTLGIPLCIEAEAGGVETGRFDTNYLNNTDEGIEVWDVNVPQSVKDQAIQKVLNDLEVSYNYLAYIWFIWRKINSIFGRDIKNQNNWFAHNGMICSQLCVAYIQALGLGYIFKDYGNGSIAPEDLRTIFRAHPELFTITYRARLAEPDVAWAS